MKKLTPFFAVGSGFALMFACTGSDPAASDGLERGSLGAECQPNGACNTGLTCTIVDGKAKCANATSEAGVTDAGTRPVCTWKPTFSVCPKNFACYSETDTDAGAHRCIATTATCETNELEWQCNSPNRLGCGSCCISGAEFHNKSGCEEATLKLNAGSPGTTCETSETCPLGRLQLCQANENCPADQHCTAMRIFATGAIDQTILGVCVP